MCLQVPPDWKALQEQLAPDATERQGLATLTASESCCLTVFFDVFKHLKHRIATLIVLA